MKFPLLLLTCGSWFSGSGQVVSVDLTSDEAFGFQGMVCHDLLYDARRSGGPLRLYVDGPGSFVLDSPDSSDWLVLRIDNPQVESGDGEGKYRLSAGGSHYVYVGERQRRFAPNTSNQRLEVEILRGLKRLPDEARLCYWPSPTQQRFRTSFETQPANELRSRTQQVDDLTLIGAIEKLTVYGNTLRIGTRKGVPSVEAESFEKSRKLLCEETSRRSLRPTTSATELGVFESMLNTLDVSGLCSRDLDVLDLAVQKRLAILNSFPGVADPDCAFLGQVLSDLETEGSVPSDVLDAHRFRVSYCDACFSKALSPDDAGRLLKLAWEISPKNEAAFRSTLSTLGSLTESVQGLVTQATAIQGQPGGAWPEWVAWQAGSIEEAARLAHSVVRLHGDSEDVRMRQAMVAGTCPTVAQFRLPTVSEERYASALRIQSDAPRCLSIQKDSRRVLERDLKRPPATISLEDIQTAGTPPRIPPGKGRLDCPEFSSRAVLDAAQQWADYFDSLVATAMARLPNFEGTTCETHPYDTVEGALKSCGEVQKASQRFIQDWSSQPASTAKVKAAASALDGPVRAAAIQQARCQLEGKKRAGLALASLERAGLGPEDPEVKDIYCRAAREEGVGRARSLESSLSSSSVEKASKALSAWEDAEQGARMCSEADRKAMRDACRESLVQGVKEQANAAQACIDRSSEDGRLKCALPHLKLAKRLAARVDGLPPEVADQIEKLESVTALYGATSDRSVSIEVSKESTARESTYTLQPGESRQVQCIVRGIGYANILVSDPVSMKGVIVTSQTPLERKSVTRFKDGSAAVYFSPGPEGLTEGVSNYWLTLTNKGDQPATLRVRVELLAVR